MSIYVWYDSGPLCFTAESANSSVTLNKYRSPTEVTLETSTDGTNRTTYTFGTYITLSNIGDKVYWRNTSTTTTGFSLGYPDYYQFSMSGSIAGSGDITSLINKNGTTTLVSVGCFYDLFYFCTALKSAPELPATTLTKNCYNQMFANCYGLDTPPKLPATTLVDSCYSGMFVNSWVKTVPQLPATTLAFRCYERMFQQCPKLVQLPKLYATTLANQCYSQMFQSCSNIRLSTTQTGKYQTSYRIPFTGTGTDGGSACYNMFTSTGGTWNGAPSINTTYYTSNIIV